MKVTGITGMFQKRGASAEKRVQKKIEMQDTDKRKLRGEKVRMGRWLMSVGSKGWFCCRWLSGGWYMALCGSRHRTSPLSLLGRTWSWRIPGLGSAQTQKQRDR